MNSETMHLLVCASTGFRSRQHTKLTQLFGVGIDWRQLLDLAQKHGLLSSLYCQFKHISVISNIDIPTSVLERLHAYFHGYNMRSIYMNTELITVLTCFNTLGIQSLPFKGVALALRVYPNPMLRQPGDLDLLIHNKDWLAAMEVLTELNYHPRSPARMSPKQEQAWLHFNPERHFYHPQRKIDLDLHWRLFDVASGITLDFDELWSRRTILEMDGVALDVMSPEDELLYLCIHGSKHGWSCLKWLVDIDAYLHTYPNLAWTEILARAIRIGAEEMLLLGLALTEELFETPLPAEVKQKIATSGTIENQVATVCESLFGVGNRTDSATTKLFLAAQPGQPSVATRQALTGRFDLSTLQCNLRLLAHQSRNTPSKLSSWLRIVFRPTPKEIEMIALPPLLYSLYYLLRAMRLAYNTTLAMCQLLKHKHFTRSTTSPQP